MIQTMVCGFFILLTYTLISYCRISDFDMFPDNKATSSSRKAKKRSTVDSSAAASTTARTNTPIAISSDWQARTVPVASSSSSSHPASVSYSSNQRTAPTIVGSAASDIQCSCATQPSLRTVVREGNTKGKQFWKCDTCGFFKWADDTLPLGASVSSNIPVKRPYSSVGLNTSQDPHIC